eukprot:g2306.t1
MTTSSGNNRVLNGEPKSNDDITRIALVGDVHNLWSEEDAVALQSLHPDMTVFVGDIGDENVSLVRKISQMNFPKAVVLGNHDSFFTDEPMIRDELKPEENMDPVNAQLFILGADHIGFSSKQVPNKQVTIVGARPFSGGGSIRHPKIVENTYGYKPEEYAQVIARVTLDAPADHATVLVGHNGPTGLGDRRFDICGLDFREEEGDYGDKDLRVALDHLERCNKSPALVTFGHMHHRLRRQYGGGHRRRLVFDDKTGTLFFNVAVVPRVVYSKDLSHRKHHFSLVEICDGKVIKASDAWVSRRNNDGSWNVESQVLFQRIYGNSEIHEEVEIYNTHVDLLERHSISNRF